MSYLVFIFFLAIFTHKLEFQTINTKTNIRNKVDKEYLYVILTYFNFAHSKRRKQLFFEFVDYLHEDFNSHLIQIVIVEAILSKNKTHSLPKFELPIMVANESPKRNRVYLHYKHKLLSIFWCKENLINFASKFKVLKFNFKILIITRFMTKAINSFMILSYFLKWQDHF